MNRLRMLLLVLLLCIVPVISTQEDACPTIVQTAVDMTQVDVNGAAWFAKAEFKALPKLDGMYVAGGGDFRDIMEPA